MTRPDRTPIGTPRPPRRAEARDGGFSSRPRPGHSFERGAALILVSLALLAALGATALFDAMLFATEGCQL